MFSYSEIAFKALGAKGKLTVDFFLSLCQFSFTVAQISFTLKALQQTIRPDLDIWWYALFLIIVYSPLAWVRKLQYFSFGYITGCIMILFTAVVVSVYCL